MIFIISNHIGIDLENALRPGRAGPNQSPSVDVDWHLVYRVGMRHSLCTYMNGATIALAPLSLYQDHNTNISSAYGVSRLELMKRTSVTIVGFLS
jgi:hypothetical protein